MRDWRKSLLPASFRGVGFFVDGETSQGGRRVAIQHVAYGEAPITEDFGSVERTFSIVAYLVSDTVDAQARRLTAALSAPGPGRLVLPMQGGLLAHAVDHARDRQKDRAGYVAFDLNFLKVGGAPAFGAVMGINGALAAFADLAGAIAAEVGRDGQ